MPARSPSVKQPVSAPKQRRLAPGTPLSSVFRNTNAMQHHTLEFLQALIRQYGDIVRIRFLPGTFYLINHPDGVKRILQENNRNYNKDAVDYRVLKEFLGRGLLTDDGPSWLEQRRLMQPIFHRQHLATFGKLMTEATLAMLQRWQDLAGQQQPVDIAAEMMRLTLRIAGKTLFSADLDVDARTIGQSFTKANQVITDYANAPFPPLFIPTPRNRRVLAAGTELVEVVTRLVKQRRQQSEEAGPPDLLSLLLQARNEETGAAMDDELVRDNVMTLLIAGHETTANALSWTWYLLSQHPDAEQRLCEELDTALNGRVPSIEDLANLPYTRMVIEEALRLYPPAWAFSRHALEDDELCGYHIPAGSDLFLSPYTTQRHPDFWERPDEFDPLRFSPERSAGRPHYAYFPFGGGPRLCIGRDFALMESRLVLATVLQQYRLRLVPGAHIEMAPLLTLRPRDGLPMTLHPVA
ncbi:cytochrome P450 [Ktedonosporobacter rubrisoli]|uniref:Cytochrome P450 n=1 Tax=Ktedonosporobacter rubrisoli TaxID=2509675 RepID=A0A4P6JK64_KTERU|nr:cytochrome P450 [Ktedonosporobacter rubrisoli]QBD75535.1 cytochrome P450 [Ktedonosporobacter rubrisoli]